MTIEHISQHKAFAGWQKQYRHESRELGCAMRFAIFIPPAASQNHRVPVLYYLSGLTCSEENFMQKAGALGRAAELGIALVVSDTSPRGREVADDDSYDLGQGAGFYLNATQEPWARNYRMYDYILRELPGLVEENFPVSQKRSIMGHSMGGHGALILGLQHPECYRSISAFSPICNPMISPWGKKAFYAYLGADRETWKAYDAVELLRRGPAVLPILIDQGDADEFLQEQLYPKHLHDAALVHGSSLQIRFQAGYDHSYYFISSFIGEHLDFHARYLLK